MGNSENSLGSLPVIITGQKDNADLYNSLYLAIGATTANQGTYFSGTSTSLNSTYSLSSIGLSLDQLSQQSYAQILPVAANPPNRNLYTNLIQSPDVTSAIEKWISNRTLPGQTTVNGAQLTYQNGSQIWLTTDSGFSYAAGASATDLAGLSNYGFIEDFVGNNSTTTQDNNIDLTGINFMDLGLEVIPWYLRYQGTDTDPRNVEIVPGKGPTAPLMLVNPTSASNFKPSRDGSSWADALSWLANRSNILPFQQPNNGSQGSAYVNAANGKRFVSPQNLATTTPTVWDTTQGVATNGTTTYYHHNFGQYLQYLSQYFISEMYGGNVPNAPWNMTPSNTANNYAIYDVQFSDGWSTLSQSNYLEKDNSVYIDICYYNAGTQLPADFNPATIGQSNLSKARLYWNSNKTYGSSTPFVDLSDPAGIYGANISFEYYSTLDATPEPVGSLGTASAATEAVGDFLSAITYGMPLGQYEGQYIKPSEWIRQPNGGSEGFLSKYGQAFGKIQNNPNYYNQHAYGAWSINQNLYGFAFSDRMQPSVSTFPEPFSGMGALTATTTRNSDYYPLTALKAIPANSKQTFFAKSDTESETVLRALSKDLIVPFKDKPELYNGQGEHRAIDRITGNIVNLYTGFPVAIGDGQQFTPYTGMDRYDLNNRVWVNDSIIKQVQKGAEVVLDGYFPNGKGVAKVISVVDTDYEDYLVLDRPYNSKIPKGTTIGIQNPSEADWTTSLAFVEVNLGGYGLTPA